MNRIGYSSVLCGSLLLATGGLHAQPTDDDRRAGSDVAVEKPASSQLAPIAVEGRSFNVTDKPEVADRLQQTRQNTPGSVSTLTPDEIELQQPNNTGEILARVPGLNYVDESGNGTKPNIGLRGLNPIRSEFTQILQDGVPTQPSIYSDPAAYHGVPVERIAGVEVIKGGASIPYGPNTVGGVVNYISRAPSPEPLAAVVDTRYDSNNDFSGNMRLSGTRGDTSYSADYLHKEGSGFGENRDLDVDDAEFVLAHHFNDDHSARVHLGYYDEASQTPGGLLPGQFEDDNKQSNKPNDYFYGTRYEADIRTDHRLTQNQSLETLFYTYSYERNWYLQDYVSNDTSNLALANSNGQFLRKFHVYGFEPKYHLDFDIGDWQNNRLTFGARVYYDEVDKRAKSGNYATARENDSTLNSFDNNSTTAYAGFVQAELKPTQRLTVVPGLRYEHIEQTNQDVLADTAEQSSTYDILLPGLGLKYALSDNSLAYANATRAFRPPASGATFDPTIVTGTFDLDSSTAWTYEAGVRLEPTRWLSTDLGGFYTQFDDQLIITAGTAANYDTEQYGFEGSADIGLLDLGETLTGQRLLQPRHDVDLRLGATLVDSTFVNGAFEGNDTPYAPDTALTFGTRYSYDERFDVLFQGRYLSGQFTDSANTVESNAIGTVGRIDSYTVYDLKTRWQASDDLSFNAGITNLFDESYGTQRRGGSQKGLFAGPRRTAFVSLTAGF
jgi:Outer membrane receptor for Fe3+-dicitrate